MGQVHDLLIREVRLQREGLVRKGYADGRRELTERGLEDDGVPKAERNLQRRSSAFDQDPGMRELTMLSHWVMAAESGLSRAMRRDAMKGRMPKTRLRVL